MRYIASLFIAFGLCACEPASLQAVADSPGEMSPNAPTKGPSELSPAPGAESEEGGGNSGGGNAGGNNAPPPPAPAAATPALVVTAPARGARALGNSLRVQGKVSDASAPKVMVNGREAEVADDGSFFVDIPVEDGLAVLETTMEDGAHTSEDHRAVLINADQDPANEVRDAIKVGISAEGFRTITALIAQNAANLDIGQLLGGAGGDQGDFEIRSINYDRIEIEIEPDFGALRLRLAMYGLRIDVADPIDVVASANPAEITALIELVPDGLGSMSLNITNSQVALADFGFDIDNFPGFLEDLLDWPVREFAEDMLKDILNDIVIPNLFDPGALDQELDLLGMKLLLGLSIDSVQIDPQGMVIGLGSSATPDVVRNPGKAVRPLGGPDGVVDPSQLDIALAADFVNRLMHAAWASGGLDLDLGGDNSAIELPINLTAGLLLGALAEAGRGVNPAEKLLIGTRALLPPVTTLHEGDLPLHITIGDFLLDLKTSEEVLVTLAVHMEIAVGIGQDENGEMKIDFEMETHVDVAEEPRGKTNEAALSTLVGGILGQLPTLLANGLEADPDAEPVPVAPISLENARFEAIGAYLHVLADIAF